MTEISSGTRRPFLRIAVIAPKAISSDSQKMAVGNFFCRKNSSIASSDVWLSKSAITCQAGLNSMPFSSNTFLKPLRR